MAIDLNKAHCHKEAEHISITSHIVTGNLLRIARLVVDGKTAARADHFGESMGQWGRMQITETDFSFAALSGYALYL